MEEILHEHSYIAEDYVEGNEEVVCLRLQMLSAFGGCSFSSQDDSFLTFFTHYFLESPSPLGIYFHKLVNW